MNYFYLQKRIVDEKTDCEINFNEIAKRYNFSKAEIELVDADFIYATQSWFYQPTLIEIRSLQAERETFIPTEKDKIKSFGELIFNEKWGSIRGDLNLIKKLSKNTTSIDQSSKIILNIKWGDQGDQSKRLLGWSDNVSAKVEFYVTSARIRSVKPLMLLFKITYD